MCTTASPKKAKSPKWYFKYGVAIYMQITRVIVIQNETEIFI